MQLRFNNEFEWIRIGSPNGHRFVDIACDTIKGSLVIKDAVGNKIDFEDWIVENYLINSSKTQAVPSEPSPNRNSDIKRNKIKKVIK